MNNIIYNDNIIDLNRRNENYWYLSQVTKNFKAIKIFALAIF